MYLHATIVFVLTLAACVSHKEQSSPASQRELLEQKKFTTSAELAKVADTETGWPSKTDCDGTLWAGIACAAGEPVKIELAEYSPGEIHRRPAPACWNSAQGDVGSKSTISNDGLLGYMWCAWAKKDLSAFQRLADRAETHDWVMGAPIEQVGDVIMRPNQIGILGRAIYRLSDRNDDRYYRRTGRLYMPVEQDYERHLQALGIALQGEVTEGDLDLVDVDGLMLDRLKELVEAEPENPLYHAVLGVYTGDMAKAVELLLRDDSLVPTYIRGDNPVAFLHTEWLFAASLALKRMED